MELDQVIQRRRSIRRFLDQPVEESQIQAVLEAARLCQSAKNRQPWRFKIVRGRTKDLVAQTMLTYDIQKDIEAGTGNSSHGTARVIQQAPILILVLRWPEEGWEASDLLSIGGAIEHMCLKAVDLGLGALWIRDTAYTESEILRELGLQDWELVSAVSLGHPAEEPFMRPRKSLDELCL